MLLTPMLWLVLTAAWGSSLKGSDIIFWQGREVRKREAGDEREKGKGENKKRNRMKTVM